MLRVSVVMPAYNAGKYIRDSIQSVLNQTYEDFELLVVDDCSTDNTAQIVETMAEKDGRIILLRVEKNAGVSAARNLGVSNAKSQWVAFLDSDDLWTPDKLEKQLNFIAANPDARITYTGSAFIDDDGKPYSYVMEVDDTVTYKQTLYKNQLSCSSVIVERFLVQKYPFGDPKMCEDAAVWLQILMEVPCAYGLNEPLLIYRLARKSRSSNRIKAAQRLYLTYRYVGYSVVKSAWLVFRYTFYSVRKRRKIKTVS